MPFKFVWLVLLLACNVIAFSRRSLVIEPTGCGCCHHAEAPTINQVTNAISKADTQKEKVFIGTDQSTIVAPNVKAALDHPHATINSKQTECAHDCSHEHGQGSIGSNKPTILPSEAETAGKHSHPTTQAIKPIPTKKVQSCCGHGHGHGSQGPRLYTCERWIAEKFNLLWQSIKNSCTRMWEILRRKKKEA